MHVFRPVLLLVACVLVLLATRAPAADPPGAQPPASPDWTQVLDGSRHLNLTSQARQFLLENGFVLSPGDQPDMADLYLVADKTSQPVFVTTDAVLHAGHVVFDLLLRLLEVDQLCGKAAALTDAMLAHSLDQYAAAKAPEVKEAARLNIGFFSVAKALQDPAFKPAAVVAPLVAKELALVAQHQGIAQRPLLPYVKDPQLPEQGYAFEDYSQYVPRGHYTRNEQLVRYFKAMMWYGRQHYELVFDAPGKPAEDGRKLTLSALLMADALAHDAKALQLWRQIYAPTAYFVGTADDLDVDAYAGLIGEVFPGAGADRFADRARVATFMTRAAGLAKPKILSGPGTGAGSNPGFRFMGQRFVPDSHMFQELVYGAAGLDGQAKPSLRYLGSGAPFTLVVIPEVGPIRGFPRGLDVMHVLGCARAGEILARMGDADYQGYPKQVAALSKLYLGGDPGQWSQNLYWRWLHALLPLLADAETRPVQPFLASPAWKDKNLQTALGSWAELRHDTILYAKQSYTGMTKSGLMPPAEMPYGYVEPAPEVYARLGAMFADLGGRLDGLGLAVAGVGDKIAQFTGLLSRLKAISETELAGETLSDLEYGDLSRFGRELKTLTRFSPEIMRRITSAEDARMDAIADVHTEPNSGRVLEVGVGAPDNVWVLIRDGRGARVCRGAVFAYHEFKWPMADRLTDAAWQQMGQEGNLPPREAWLTRLEGR